jgi:hypothetical protein
MLRNDSASVCTPFCVSESVEPSVLSAEDAHNWGELPEGLDLGWLLPAGLGDLEGLVTGEGDSTVGLTLPPRV